MALIYRGRTFDAHNATAQTVSTTVTGLYRGASVKFRQAATANRQTGTAKQYRGVAY